MNKQRLARLKREIWTIKEALIGLGDMRPGSLSRQMRMAKEKYGSYWHLSYTYGGKGKTEYVREDFVKQVKRETENFKQYRKLSNKLVKLSIEISRLKMKLAKNVLSK
jgi:hypothetical protein